MQTVAIHFRYQNITIVFVVVALKIVLSITNNISQTLKSQSNSLIPIRDALNNPRLILSFSVHIYL